MTPITSEEDKATLAEVNETLAEVTAILDKTRRVQASLFGKLPFLKGGLASYASRLEYNKARLEAGKEYMEKVVARSGN